MPCYSCGAQLPVGAAFCPTCGVILLPNDSDSRASPNDPTMPSSTPSTPTRKLPLSPTQLASLSYRVSLQNPYAQAVPYEDIPPPPPRLRTRLVGRTLLSVFSYLWGTLWLFIGLLFILDPLLGTSGIVALIIIIYCVVGLVMLIFLMRTRKSFYLSTGRRIFLEIGLMIIGFVLYYILYTLLYHPQSGETFPLAFYLPAGIVLVIFGLLMTFVAYW